MTACHDGAVVDHALVLFPQEPALPSLVHRQYTALNAILGVMVLLHKPELNNYGVSSYGEDHNHQNG